MMTAGRLLLVVLLLCPAAGLTVNASDAPIEGSRQTTLQEPDPEMLEHLDMLMDMDVLESMDLLETVPLLGGGHDSTDRRSEDDD